MRRFELDAERFMGRVFRLRQVPLALFLDPLALRSPREAPGANSSPVRTADRIALRLTEGVPIESWTMRNATILSFTTPV